MGRRRRTKKQGDKDTTDDTAAYRDRNPCLQSISRSNTATKETTMNRERVSDNMCCTHVQENNTPAQNNSHSNSNHDSSSSSSSAASFSAPVPEATSDGDNHSSLDNVVEAFNASSSSSHHMFFQFDPSHMAGIIKRKAMIKELAASYHAECLSCCQELISLQRMWEQELEN